ncbi:hypothetical protein M0R45_030578 [Rubus argutus]|uniref:Uncharacterized protein n=1 Tax=Rubus argutus TaxID=59490 RepID=A0AAW1WFK9_RUBAR
MERIKEAWVHHKVKDVFVSSLLTPEDRSSIKRADLWRLKLQRWCLILSKPDSSASVILADKGESIKASYLHHLSKLNGGAVVGEVARNISFHPKTLHKNPKFGLTLSLTP